MKQTSALAIACILSLAAFGQGSLSGSLQMDNSFYVRDTVIGASGIPLYDHLLSGSDIWFGVNYTNSEWGLSAGGRFDAFLNSNLHDPTLAFTGAGIGRLFVSKDVGKATVTAGHMYDEFGTGLTFRAYEERGLGIDNALLGVRVKYQLNDNWSVKGLAGQQKNLFETYAPIVKGLNVDGFHSFNENFSLAPGGSVVNRTLDQDNMNLIVNVINSYPEEDRFVPKHNVYVWSLYNTLVAGPVSWYAEFAAKTDDVIADINGDYIGTPGSVFYSNATYARKGFAITGHVKRTENFSFRTSPNEMLLDGTINFLPPLARQNTFRLPARYNAATQELGELALMADVLIKPSTKTSITLNTAFINNLEETKLFREFYADVQHRASSKFKILVGGQYISYNQVVYEAKGDSEMVAITPFVEAVIKVTRKKSIKTELQYMNNAEDFGSWFWALVEYSIAPTWSFAVSDMWNVDPKKTADPLHYPTVFISYTKGANRFALSFVKQVEGIVCTGGICRFEPAFSGAKFGVTSNF